MMFGVKYAADQPANRREFAVDFHPRFPFVVVNSPGPDLPGCGCGRIEGSHSSNFAD